MSTLRGFVFGIPDVYKKIAQMIDIAATVNEVRQAAFSMLIDNGETVQDINVLDRDAVTAEKIYLYVRDNITYVDDVDGIETLTEPLTTLQNGFGDCDDMVILLGSLYRAMGYPVALVMIKMEGFTDYNHIYLAVHTVDGWRYADATNKEGVFGWEIEIDRYTARKVIVLSDPNIDVTGLKNEKTVLEYYDADPVPVWPFVVLAGAGAVLIKLFLKL